jgi:hypothetical protein
MNKNQELSSAKFTFSDFFDFTASENFESAKRKKWCTTVTGHAANKFSLVFVLIFDVFVIMPHAEN